jgi:hypothetical protein
MLGSRGPEPSAKPAAAERASAGPVVRICRRGKKNDAGGPSPAGIVDTVNWDLAPGGRRGVGDQLAEMVTSMTWFTSG